MAASATHAIVVAKLNPSSAARVAIAPPRLSPTHAVYATLAAAVAALTVATLSVNVDAGPLPSVPGRSAYATLFDVTPVAVTVTADWQKVGVVVPRYAITSDATLWRRMHFEDWDRLPAELRGAGLTAMFERFRWALGGPALWRRMTAEQWDRVPQPVRAVAYIRMVAAWTRHYDVGAPWGLSPLLVGDTAAAIVMAESWFEHRGVYINPDGGRDLGLGGASEYCRRTLVELHARGLTDFDFAEADYFNPWRASRAVAVWLAVMLDEANGSLELAVRAYHTGITRARRGAGAEYAAAVLRDRRRYIRNQGAPPSWAYVFRAAITRPSDPANDARTDRPAGGS